MNNPVCDLEAQALNQLREDTLFSSFAVQGSEATSDYGCYWYSIFTSFTTPVDKKAMREQRLKTYPAPDYKPTIPRCAMARARN